MISDEVRQAGLAAIAVAAAMLVEDAHSTMVVVSTAAGQGATLAAVLARLGADLTAFADAAAVFAHDELRSALRERHHGRFDRCNARPPQSVSSVAVEAEVDGAAWSSTDLPWPE